MEIIWVKFIVQNFDSEIWSVFFWSLFLYLMIVPSKSMKVLSPDTKSYPKS